MTSDPQRDVQIISLQRLRITTLLRVWPLTQARGPQAFHPALLGDEARSTFHVYITVVCRANHLELDLALGWLR